MAGVQDQLDVLKAQLKAQLLLQREAAVKAETSRHKSPQIKVYSWVSYFSISITFLFIYIERLTSLEGDIDFFCKKIN